VVKKRLKRLARWLVAEAGGEVKVFVDTAPVMEKPLGEAAGLGWQGKHTNLVSRDLGNWFFLGAIFTTLDLEPRCAGGRSLRLLPGLSGYLPDGCVSRALPAGCAALHFLPDHRAQGAGGRGFARGWATGFMAATIAWRSARGTSSRSRRADALRRARRSAGAAAGRPGRAGRCGVPRAVFGLSRSSGSGATGSCATCCYAIGKKRLTGLPSAGRMR
jgi:hypothetical protein